MFKVKKVRNVSDEELQLFVDEALPVTEIARRLGENIHRFSAVYLLKKRTYHSLWKKARKKKVEEEIRARNEMKVSVKVFEFEYLRQYTDEEFVVRKAFEYYDAGYTKIHFSKLLKLFAVYEAAKHYREKKSYEELAREAGISHATMVGKILNRVKLKSLYRNIVLKKVTQEEGEAILESYDVPMPLHDIVNFFDYRSRFPIAQRFKSHKGNGRRNYSHFILQKGKGKGCNLSYFLASQILDLMDQGAEDISDRLEIRPELVDYTKEHRKEIEQPIIRLLRIIYKEREINQPYL